MMKINKCFAAPILVAVFSISSVANAALVERLGGLAYYDTEADLTWLADANYAWNSLYDNDGRMTWAEANTWATGLSVGGVDGWRLPTTIDAGNDGRTYTNIYEGVDYGYNITTHSELSNLYFNVLGNKAYYDTNGIYQSDYNLKNTGPFSYVQSYYYWSGTEYDNNTDEAWFFDFDGGFQNSGINTPSYYAWAVQSGDVSAVPVPAAVWLFGSGLIGLIGVARRKKA